MIISKFLFSNFLKLILFYVVFNDLFNLLIFLDKHFPQFLFMIKFLFIKNLFVLLQLLAYEVQLLIFSFFMLFLLIIILLFHFMSLSLFHASWWNLILIPITQHFLQIPTLLYDGLIVKFPCNIPLLNLNVVCILQNLNRCLNVLLFLSLFRYLLIRNKLYLFLTSILKGLFEFQ